MSLMDVFNVSALALSAQSQRLNVVASNLANADSEADSFGQLYRAKHVMFVALPMDDDGLATGVKVSSVLEDQRPGRRVHNPSHPSADENGYVTMPNVSVADEMVNMISASRSYQTNVEVMNSAKQLLLKTLDLLKG